MHTAGSFSVAITRTCQRRDDNNSTKQNRPQTNNSGRGNRLTEAPQYQNFARPPGYLLLMANDELPRTPILLPACCGTCWAMTTIPTHTHTQQHKRHWKIFAHDLNGKRSSIEVCSVYKMAYRSQIKLREIIKITLDSATKLAAM